ncbi:hypothetical protein G7Y89_g11293 [Cudoniella acicularis]|uniref:Uncharacterized protein n=1 Tax=Cudoniella acicularis TaxID=354080 RepID=A0A8H4RCM2_9HELO|nr:hypothetical protein G7Y89_g11293 [Cudoniella acicularis]
MGLQLALRAEKELTDVYPEFKDYQNVLITILPMIGETRVEENTIELDDELARRILVPAHTMLDEVCDNKLQPCKVLIMKNRRYNSQNGRLAHLYSTANRVKSTLQRYLDFLKGIKNPDTWPKQNQDCVQLIAIIDKSVLKDPVFPHKEHQRIQLSLPSHAESERLFLYKNHPVLCGLSALRKFFEFQELGVTLINTWGTIIYLAHLYNALRHKTQPIEPWTMMEEVIALHSEGCVFVRAAPMVIQDSFNVFREGLLGDGNGTAVLTIDNIENLLNDQARIASLASDRQNKALRREWRNPKRLTSLELLQALREIIPIELPKL